MSEEDDRAAAAAAARREDLAEKIKRKRLMEAVAAKRAAGEAEGQSGLNQARGALQSYNRGTMLGFGDEIVGAARAGIDRLFYDEDHGLGDDVSSGRQSMGDAYRMYRNDERAVQEQFAEEHGGLALALEMAGGFTSPVNRIAPGFGMGGKGADALAKTIGRGSIEGAVVGAGEAEELEDVGRSMGAGAFLGGGASGVLGGVVGGISGQIGKRRIAEDLMQPDGTFKPIHLADEEGGVLGDVYRQTLGRVWGAKNALKEQEAPFVREVAEEFEDVTRRLDDEAIRVEDDYIRDMEQIQDTTAARGEAVGADTANRIDNMTAQAGEAAEREAAKFRRTAAVEAVPTHGRDAFEDIDIDDPRAVREKLSDWWFKSGFREVKDREFLFDDTLKKNIKEMLDDDPSLRMELNGVLGRIKGMQAQLGGAPEEIDDILTAMLTQGKVDLPTGMDVPQFFIDGEALMAMRNIFARGANGGQRFSAAAQRQVANKFDDLIRRQLDDAGAQAFDENISRYTTALSYMDATRGAAAREAGGRFSPSGWMTASGKYGGKGMSAKEPPLERTASARAQRATEAKKAVPKRKAAARAEGAARKGSVRRQGLVQSREARARKRAANLDIRAEHSRDGALGQARERVQEMKRQATPSSASGLSELLTTGVVGDALPGPKFGGKAGSVARGVGLGRALVTEGSQKFIAGQTAWQRKLLEDLERGRYTPVTRGLSRAAARYGSGG